MSAPAVILRGLIGTAAVALPGIALGVAVVSVLYGAGPYLGWLGVTYLVVGAMAWTCVRGGGFPVWLAMGLTTLPFGLMLLLTVPHSYGVAWTGFLIALGELALALLVAWLAASLLVRKRP